MGNRRFVMLSYMFGIGFVLMGLLNAKWPLIIAIAIFTFVTPTQFFYIIATGAFLSWLICLVWLKEPQGAFDEEYYGSSVDRMIEEQELAASQAKPQQG